MPTIIINYPILSKVEEKLTKTILVEYGIGQFVVVRTDPDKMTRIITGWLISESGIMYRTQLGANEATFHYPIELELVEEFS